MSDKFTFTVTDLARFLGKSAVTLRTWERQGLVDLPRDSGGDRKLDVEGVRSVAQWAWTKGRISRNRYDLIAATVYLLQTIEEKNDANKNFRNRRTRKR